LAKKKNEDDPIYRTSGVFLRNVEPAYMAGSDVIRGNQYIDFNVRVMGARNTGLSDAPTRHQEAETSRDDPPEVV